MATKTLKNKRTARKTTDKPAAKKTAAPAKKKTTASAKTAPAKTAPEAPRTRGRQPGNNPYNREAGVATYSKTGREWKNRATALFEMPKNTNVFDLIENGGLFRIEALMGGTISDKSVLKATKDLPASVKFKTTSRFGKECEVRVYEDRECVVTMLDTERTHTITADRFTEHARFRTAENNGPSKRTAPADKPAKKKTVKSETPAAAKKTAKKTAAPKSETPAAKKKTKQSDETPAAKPAIKKGLKKKSLKAAAKKKSLGKPTTAPADDFEDGWED